MIASEARKNGTRRAAVVDADLHTARYDAISGTPMSSETDKVRLMHQGRILGYTAKGRFTNIMGLLGINLNNSADLGKYGVSRVFEPEQKVYLVFDFAVFMESASSSMQEKLFLQVRFNKNLGDSFPPALRLAHPIPKPDLVRRPRGNA